jgi:hypothetical protein
VPYDLHVVRTERWTDAARKPIRWDEVIGLIASDPDLQWSASDYADMQEGDITTRYYLICWRGTHCFWWFRDQITCATPDEAQKLKLIDIASQLGWPSCGR